MLRWARIDSFENFKLGPIAADEPVIAQRLCVLLLRLHDQFGRVSLESLQLPLPNRPVSDYVKSVRRLCVFS
jgi:hypothetical protein